MKTTKRVWIIVAVCLIAFGAIICVLSLSKLNFNFESLSTEKFITNEHNITEDFSNINIDVNTSDIKLVRSENNECKVVAVETENIKHTVTVNNDTLSILVEGSREWYDYIGISFGEMSITIYLPKDSYDLLNIEGDTSDITIPQDFIFTNIEIETDTGDVWLLSSALQALDISTDTGDVKIQDIKAKSITLETHTGKTDLTGVNCSSLVSSGSTGDISFKNVDAGKKFSITRETGDVKFDGCDAEELFIITDTGDVSGNLLTSKVFVCETDTGNINVPQTTEGGRCKIITDTGDIYFNAVK